MDKVILILTGRPDPHPNSVINLLRERNIPFYRLNTEVLMSDYDFTWYCDNSRQDIVIQNIKNGQLVHGHQIDSVWCRRPNVPNKLRLHSTQSIDEHNLSDAKTFYHYLMYYLSERYSIGHFLYDRYASSKMVQLRLAARLGIKIPCTCISNTKDGIADFAQSMPEVLLKSISSNVLQNEGMVYELYATKVNTRELIKQPEDAFVQTVNFCENYVPKDYEVRVTVMGPHLFACKLDSQAQKEDEGRIDWRQGYDYNLKHELISLPAEIEDFCKRYLRELHLNFGCFDFIVEPSGEYVFLECNPNGQWRWIEEELNITSMTEAMVDCLVNKLTV